MQFAASNYLILKKLRGSLKLNYFQFMINLELYFIFHNFVLMKKSLLFMLLLGMVLIHVPRSLIHECTEPMHEDHDHDSDSEEHQGLSFEVADCDLCYYSFHSLDTPKFAIVPLPNGHINVVSSWKFGAVTVGSVQNIQLRGPPSSLRLS